MAKLETHLSTALSESRILVLGTQVLLGFKLRSVFEMGFSKLPVRSQHLEVGSMLLIVAALTLLQFPAAFHQIAARGQAMRSVERAVYGVMDSVLTLFSISLGLSVFIAMENILGATAAFVGSGVFILFAFSLFFVWTRAAKAKRRERIEELRAMEHLRHEDEEGKAKTSEKIKHALTEARVILPGVQALMGFQFAVVLTPAFDELSFAAKLVHLVSFGLICVAMLLLMAPAAYHRISERGEETEHFHQVTSRLLIASLVPVSLGIAADVGLVVWKVLHSLTACVVICGLIVAAMWTLWFVVPVMRRGGVARRLEREASA